MKRLVLLLLCVVLLLSGCGEHTEEGIDLYGTYDQNDLLIDAICETHNEVEINIPYISGLKNTAVQDKINNAMYSRATALVEKHPAINYANYYTYANFANVISISFTVGFDEEPYSESIYFNHSLVDGAQLKFEDLFMGDTNLVDIIRSAVYKQMALYGGYDSDTYVHYPNEEEVYKIVKGYLEEENKTFAFSPSAIFLYPKNHFAEVKMIDHADSITIYSKYTTKDSLFTGEYQSFKNLFTCANAQYDMFDVIEYGYLEENLWYDFTVSQSYFPFENPPEDARLEKFGNFREKVIDQERTKLNLFRETARANPDKFYIVFSKPSVSMDNNSKYINGQWHYTYYDTLTVHNNIQLFEMPLDLYKTVYNDKIIEMYRYEYFAMRGGAWLDTENLDGATLTENSYEAKYNYLTGEKED